MRNPSYRVLIFIPIAAFLALLVCVAVFVAHPSTLGWIGLAVIGTASVAVGVIAAVLFPRSRINARRERPRIGDPFRLLVIVDAGCRGTALCDAVLDRAAGRDAEVFVVAPVIASPLHVLAEEEPRERSAAASRLREALSALARHGIDARGTIGADDPVTAVGDALAEFPAAEILLVAPDGSHRRWLERDLERVVRDAYGVHVSTLISAEPASRGAVGASQ